MQFHSGKELEGETHVDIDDVRAASIGYQYREGLYNESSELTTSEKFKQWLQFEKFWKHHNDETNDDNESESSSSDSPMCKMNDNFKRFLKFMKYRDRSSSNGSSNSSTDQKVESSDDKKMTKSVTETSVINNDEKIETSKNAESPDSSSEKNSRNVSEVEMYLKNINFIVSNKNMKIQITSTILFINLLQDHFLCFHGNFTARNLSTEIAST